MSTLRSTLDAGTPEYAANRDAMLERLAALDTEHAKAVAGGGEKYTSRHHKRGKLLIRERIELLLDPGAHFLELSALAAWGSDFTVGASVVTGIGVVNGVECLISGSDPTVRGGASNPWTLKKSLRAHQVNAPARMAAGLFSILFSNADALARAWILVTDIDESSDRNNGAVAFFTPRKPSHMPTLFAVLSCARPRPNKARLS